MTNHIPFFLSLISFTIFYRQKILIFNVLDKNIFTIHLRCWSQFKKHKLTCNFKKAVGYSSRFSETHSY